MQYLIQDILKLPLKERLIIIENLLCSILPDASSSSDVQLFGQAKPETQPKQ